MKCKASGYLMKNILTGVAAVALTVSPTVAAAQAAAPTQLAPAEEAVEGSELRGGFIIPLLAIVAIILGILAATGELEGDDEGAPRSP